MARMPVNQNASAEDMANTIFGDGVTVVSASYSGDNSASGIFSNGDAVSPDATPSDTGVILSTGKARDFSNRNGGNNQDTNTSTNTNGEDNNAEFNALAGANTYDAAYLDISFIPTGTTMTMQFVFASEEYPEYVDSIFQDFVAVSVNGAYVDMAIGNGDVDPGNINDGENESLFIDNTGGLYNTEMDGFTQTMTLTMTVIPGVVNTIRIVIADVADSSYDSALLIAANSVQTTLVAETDDVTMGLNTTRTVDVLANDENTTGNSLLITHISGQAIAVGSSITLPSGQVITLNADGTITIGSDGDEETANFTYTVSDGNGSSDVGFVTVTQAPCFAAGTFIETPYGEVPVECLSVGDMVETLDNGPQPIRWIGGRKVRAEGRLAPIQIAENTFGNHRRLTLSPLHRILVQDGWAQLLFGEDEVLVAARDLVNGKTVQRLSGGWIEYFHILFDDHQIIFSEKLATESYLPGPQTSSSFEPEIVQEIYAIFPELDLDTGAGYGPMARPGLKAFEVAALAQWSAVQ